MTFRPSPYCTFSITAASKLKAQRTVRSIQIAVLGKYKNFFLQTYLKLLSQITKARIIRALLY